MQADALSLLDHVAPESVDLVITSPPYWDVLTRRRSADRKETRHYGEQKQDLGRIASYEEFLTSLTNVFRVVHQASAPAPTCIVIVMDLRKGPALLPLPLRPRHPLAGRWLPARRHHHLGHAATTYNASAPSATRRRSRE